MATYRREFDLETGQFVLSEQNAAGEWVEVHREFLLDEQFETWLPLGGPVTAPESDKLG